MLNSPTVVVLKRNQSFFDKVIFMDEDDYKTLIYENKNTEINHNYTSNQYNLEQIESFNREIDNLYAQFQVIVSNDEDFSQQILELLNLLNKNPGIAVKNDQTNDLIQVLLQYIDRLGPNSYEAVQILEILSTMPNILLENTLDLLNNEDLMINTKYCISILDITRNILNSNEILYQTLDLTVFLHPILNSVHSNNEIQVSIALEVLILVLKKILHANIEFPIINEIWMGIIFVSNSLFTRSDIFVAQIIDLLLNLEQFRSNPDFIMGCVDVFNSNYLHNKYLVAVCSQIIKYIEDASSLFDFDSILTNLEYFENKEPDDIIFQQMVTFCLLSKFSKFQNWQNLDNHLKLWIEIALNGDYGDLKHKYFAGNFLAEIMKLKPYLLANTDAVGQCFNIFDDVFDDSGFHYQINKKIIHGIQAIYHYCISSDQDLATYIMDNEFIETIKDFIVFEDHESEFPDFLATFDAS